MPLHMKNINNLPSEKNGSVSMTHQKHLVQSGRSTRSAVDIFNTLHVFTKEPIREHQVGVYEYEPTAFYLLQPSCGDCAQLHASHNTPCKLFSCTSVR